MNVVYIITSSLFFLWIFSNIFFWLSIWQHNEYRPDRFFAYLTRKKQKIHILFSPIAILKLVLFFGYVVVIFNDNVLPIYQYTIGLFYLSLALLTMRRIYLNSLKKPVLTLRENLIIFLTLTTIFLLFAFPLMDRFFWIIFIDLLTPFLITFFVFLFLFPIEIYDDWQSEKAVKKIRSHQKILVIGITGSYGKSLTKDYIAHILEKKFRVAKTNGMENTAGGIARAILKRVQSDTEIFVAEMSAYQRGEIALLCEFIRPQIGVLTGINNHYLPLFKTLDNIKKTNYELVESLPTNGFCLYNGTSKNTHELYKKSRKKKYLYTALNVVQKGKKTTFDAKLKTGTIHLVVSSSHTIEYLLPAIFIAHHLGMNNTEIKKAIASLS